MQSVSQSVSHSGIQALKSRYIVYLRFQLKSPYSFIFCWLPHRIVFNSFQWRIQSIHISNLTFRNCSTQLPLNIKFVFCFTHTAVQCGQLFDCLLETSSNSWCRLLFLAFIVAFVRLAFLWFIFFLSLCLSLNEQIKKKIKRSVNFYLKQHTVKQMDRE